MRKLLNIFGALALFGLFAGPAAASCSGVFLPGAVCANFSGSSAIPGPFVLGTNVPAWLQTPTSANLAAAVTDETGTGSLVFANSPVFMTPNLGVPSAVDLLHATDLPNSATTATSANTTSAIVARDGSGNFSAGTISATLNGYASTASAAPLSGITGLGTGVGAALGTNIGSAGAPVVNGGALGTPSGGVGTNITGVNAAQLAGATWASPPAAGYGSSTPEPVAATTVAATSVTAASLGLSSLAFSATAPTVSSCGSGASISAPNGTVAMDITMGSGTFNSCTIGLTTAGHGWNCWATDITTNSTSVFLQKMSAHGTTSVVITNYNDVAAATNFSASGDHLLASCFAY